MADKCEFCGELLVDGVCTNPECDLSDVAPAISDQADFSEDTFLPDLDLDADDLDLDEVLPELSNDQGAAAENIEPTMEFASEPAALPGCKDVTGRGYCGHD